MKILAVTAPGLEGILARELSQLGLKAGASISGGVELTGGLSDLHRANLWSRVANRIVVRAAEFHASSFFELERRAKKIEWGKFVTRDTPVTFRVTCRKSRLYHSDAVAERLMKAVLGATGASTASSASEDEEHHGQQFVVRIADDICTISADSSGDLLHKRGYRQAIAKAPLRETIAAAMLIGSGWDSQHPLIDPMCGSGTIAIEGAMMSRKIAPGARRQFAFEQWPDHNPLAWQAMIDEARSGELQSAAASIIASDRDAGAVEAARSNAERAGVGADVKIHHQPISASHFPDPPAWVVSNPPYGERIGESGRLRNLYAKLGSIIREKPAGYVLALLSADRKLEGQIGLDMQEVFRTTNGGIPVRLIAGENR